MAAHCYLETGLLKLLGASRREMVETIGLYQSVHHCNIGKAAFTAGGVSTHFIG